MTVSIIPTPDPNFYTQNFVRNSGLEDELNIVYRTLANTDHVRPCRIPVPRAGGVASSGDESAGGSAEVSPVPDSHLFGGTNPADRSVAQPAHCKPFTDLPALGMELYWPYPCSVRITADYNGRATIDSSEFPKYTGNKDSIKQFAPGHVGINTNFGARVPRGWGLLILPHPRAYCNPFDPANTTPYILPGVVEFDWWPALFFVVGLTPPVGRTYRLDPGEPYALLVPIRTRVHSTVRRMSDADAQSAAEHQRYVYDNYSSLSTYNWTDSNGKRFGNMYKQLSARFRRNHGLMDWETIAEELKEHGKLLTPSKKETPQVPNPSTIVSETEQAGEPPVSTEQTIHDQTEVDTVNATQAVPAPEPATPTTPATAPAPQTQTPKPLTAWVEIPSGLHQILSTILAAHPDLDLSPSAAKILSRSICERMPALGSIKLEKDSVILIEADHKNQEELDLASSVGDMLARALPQDANIVFAVVPKGIPLTQLTDENLLSMGLARLPPAKPA